MPAGCTAAGEIDMLPWTEMESLHPEAGTIQEHLTELCQKGLLTINSQPQVNAAPSSDAHVGWGGKGG